MKNDLYKFDKKIKKNYNIDKEELQHLSLFQAKNLKNVNRISLEENDKFKLIKKPMKVILKGSSIGAGLSGILDTIFPNIIPVLGSIVISNTNTSSINKALSFSLMASKPVDILSGKVVIGIGAILGALTYSSYSLVKTGISNLKIKNDIKKAKEYSKTLK